MLRASQGAGGLAALDPVPHAGGNLVGVIPEGTGLHDGVLGRQIQIGHRGENPVDAYRSGFLSRHRGGPPHHVRVTYRRQRHRRGKFRQSGDLLPGAALEIGRQQQRSSGPSKQVGGQLAYRFRRAAEDDESAHSDLQRIRYPTGFVGESAERLRAQCGQDEARGNPARDLGPHAGVTVPRTRAPSAPVAAGRLPGCPCSVRYPNSANATASLASPGKNKSSKRRNGWAPPSWRWRERLFISIGWWQPPPEATTSTAGGVQRAIASATVRAVSSTAVATAS